MFAILMWFQVHLVDTRLTNPPPPQSFEKDGHRDSLQSLNLARFSQFRWLVEVESRLCLRMLEVRRLSRGM